MAIGGRDTLIPLEGGLKVLSEASSKDKTLIFCEEAKHDLAHEEEIFEIMDMVVN